MVNNASQKAMISGTAVMQKDLENSWLIIKHKWAKIKNLITNHERAQLSAAF